MALSLAQLKKPHKLNKGDKVVTVSLSWGGAGDEGIKQRYEIGKSRLIKEFGLEVIEMPHTLMGSQYLYDHPESRAQDLMDAFRNPEIKAIFSCIGGDETIRLLPYIDFDVIRENPKIFMGYSDTTTNHLMCLKAGLASFYGPSVLAEFAENVAMPDYTKSFIQKALFTSDPIGMIPSSQNWTSERLEWHIPENASIARTLHAETHGIECLNGTGKAVGRLIGGCMEVFDELRGTALWPEDHLFDDAILFLETSEEEPSPEYLLRALRVFSVMGILKRLNGIVFGKPHNETHYEAYKQSIRKAIIEEGQLTELPILFNLNFGHTAPMCVLPYGALAEIDCETKCFSVLETSVI